MNNLITGIKIHSFVLPSYYKIPLKLITHFYNFYFWKTNRNHLNKLCVMFMCWTNNNFSKLSSAKKCLLGNRILKNKHNKKISIFNLFNLLFSLSFFTFSQFTFSIYLFHVTFCRLNAFRFFRNQLKAIEMQ